MRHFHNARRSRTQPEALISETATPDRKRRRFPANDKASMNDKAPTKVSAPGHADRAGRRRRLLEDVLRREHGSDGQDRDGEWA